MRLGHARIHREGDRDGHVRVSPVGGRDDRSELMHHPQLTEFREARELSDDGRARRRLAPIGRMNPNVRSAGVRSHTAVAVLLVSA